MSRCHAEYQHVKYVCQKSTQHGKVSTETSQNSTNTNDSFVSDFWGEVRSTGPKLGLVLEFGCILQNTSENLLASADCQNT